MDTNTPQEAMIRAAIKRTHPEETSSDFVADVMRKIKTSEITIYKPLISRKGWLGIALGVAVIMFGVFYFDNDIVLPELFDFKEISTYTLPDIFDKISLSKKHDLRHLLWPQ